MKKTILTILFIIVAFNVMAQPAKNVDVVQSVYPKFSWDTTPQYFMFADGKRVLTTSEVKLIANKTNFICIEKNHAMEQLGAAEIGAKYEVKAFKSLNPDIKVLFYFNSAYAWPFTSYNKNFTRERIDKYPELKNFLIKEQNGELAHRNNVFFFDVLNQDFRNWWVNTVVEGVKFSKADGVFIDQMHGFAWLRPNTKKEVEKAMAEMMLNLKSKLGKDKIVLGNNAARVNDVFPSVDAVMFEHYNKKLVTKEKLLEDWEDMLKVAQAGKISVFRIGVEIELENEPSKISLEELSKKKLEYYLACYLIGAQPYSYFQYGWGWRLNTGPLVDYTILSNRLGAPKGEYKRVNPLGWEFTRAYQYAEVWVNTDKQEAKIIWR